MEGLPGAGGSWSPPYLSQPFIVRFSKFLCLVKACENRHWFLFHKWLPIVHRMVSRSREGQSRQYFQAKNPKFSIFSYKYEIRNRDRGSQLFNNKIQNKYYSVDHIWPSVGELSHYRLPALLIFSNFSSHYDFIPYLTFIVFVPNFSC